mmetsp:Transcript_28692/g.95247  ORF Transcript_28692/g.95247 Transcript_28692/m.95247 type:complete len:320 (+) Transcript_28692:993-1952(+)
MPHRLQTQVLCDDAHQIETDVLYIGIQGGNPVEQNSNGDAGQPHGHRASGTVDVAMAHDEGILRPGLGSQAPELEKLPTDANLQAAATVLPFFHRQHLQLATSRHSRLGGTCPPTQQLAQSPRRGAEAPAGGTGRAVAELGAVRQQWVCARRAASLKLVPRQPLGRLNPIALLHRLVLMGLEVLEELGQRKALDGLADHPGHARLVFRRQREGDVPVEVQWLQRGAHRLGGRAVPRHAPQQGRGGDAQQGAGEVGTIRVLRRKRHRLLHTFFVAEALRIHLFPRERPGEESSVLQQLADGHALLAVLRELGPDLPDRSV